MKSTLTSLSATALALAAFGLTGAAAAVPVFCKEASPGHRDAVELRLCLAEDTSAIKDDVLSLDERYNTITLAIQPVGSEQLNRWLVHFWFVHFANPPRSSGNWSFVKLSDQHGRLRHINPHGRSPAKSIPEPGTLALLGIGLVGAGLARRRKRV